MPAKSSPGSRRASLPNTTDPDSPDFTWPLGDRIKARRDQLGIKMADFVAGAGLSKSYADTLLRGFYWRPNREKAVARPSAPVLTRVAQVLSMDPAELFAFVPGLEDVEAPAVDPTAAADMSAQTLAALITELRPRSRRAVQALVERLHEGDQALAAQAGVDVSELH